ncbi:hypothetical protein CVT24_012425 [Panaeolus cyanescens]|uniref:Uncharacterized protein n=1 Tax=Panaeolus cyanescens TaxID=181874 RepID=A0A409WU98_9AGAR|nr:hypothetical protein CVT24_012425 [Panaeolus cyanescens]
MASESPTQPQVVSVMSELTQYKTSAVNTACGRPSCSTVIPPGDKIFYIAPKGQPNVPGQSVCLPCYKYYIGKPDTEKTMSKVSQVPFPSSASQGVQGPDYSKIRSMVNLSQRQGAHTPQGRVIAMPQRSVSNPTPSDHATLYQRFFESPSAQSLFQDFIKSAPPPSISGNPAVGGIGYFSAHSQYNIERNRWASTSYRPPAVAPANGQIPARAQAQQVVRIVATVSYLGQAGKFEKTVSTIFL